jgi:hypothetical protein
MYCMYRRGQNEEYSLSKSKYVRITTVLLAGWVPAQLLSQQSVQHDLVILCTHVHTYSTVFVCTYVQFNSNKVHTYVRTYERMYIVT